MPFIMFVSFLFPSDPDDLNPVGGPARSSSDPPQPRRGIGFEPLQDSAGGEFVVSSAAVCDSHEFS